MKLRKIFALGIVSAVALLPSAGHAVGEASRSVPGTDCTVGTETLKYITSGGYWSGSAEADCAAPGHPGLTLNFVLRQVQGVNTVPAPGLAGPARMTSSVDGGPINTTFQCISQCTKLVATGIAVTLDTGLYVMKSEAVVASAIPFSNSYSYRRGSHSTCFLIQSADAAPTPVPGCSL